MKRLSLALLFLGSVFIPQLALGECQLVELANTSNIVRVALADTTTGNGKTALTNASTGLRISAGTDNETGTAMQSYTQAGGTIQTIAAIGTYAAPSASNARFGEVDATKAPGLYEIQFLDTRFNVANSKVLYVYVGGVTGLRDTYCAIPLVHPPSDFWTVPTFAELSAVPGATPTAGQMIQWVYELMRHKVTQTATTSTLFKADSSTSLSTSTTADDGTTFTRGKYN